MTEQDNRILPEHSQIVLMGFYIVIFFLLSFFLILSFIAVSFYNVVYIMYVDPLNVLL